MLSVPAMTRRRRRSQVDFDSRECVGPSTKRTAAEQILKISNPAPAIPDGNIENSLCMHGMLAGCGDLNNPEKRMPQSSIWMIRRAA
jgi:hypothetical protein